MKRIEAEFSRRNVTPGQFLSYVRANLRKRGMGAWADAIDYENFITGNGLNCKTNHKELCDEAYTQLGVEYEEVRDLPYDKKSYSREANGVVCNEIIEFIFDDEKTGHGYYFAVDYVDEAESVESTTDKTTAAKIETETETETEAETVAESEAQPVESEPAKAPTIEEIANEFASQQKYCDEMWSYNHPETNDCLVQYWYSWEDEDGIQYKDCVDIFLNTACCLAGVDFDCVDDGDIEGRVLEEMEERGYTVNDDNEIVIEEGMDEYAVREEMDDIRAELWEQAQNEAEWARDELCAHEDLTEKWFQELCREMLDKVNATIAE